MITTLQRWKRNKTVRRGVIGKGNIISGFNRPPRLCASVFISNLNFPSLSDVTDGTLLRATISCAESISILWAVCQYNWGLQEAGRGSFGFRFLFTNTRWRADLFPSRGIRFSPTEHLQWCVYSHRSVICQSDWSLHSSQFSCYYDRPVACWW